MSTLYFDTHCTLELLSGHTSHDCWLHCHVNYMHDLIYKKKEGLELTQLTHMLTRSIYRAFHNVLRDYIST
jgi:hypothetical protein